MERNRIEGKITTIAAFLIEKGYRFGKNDIFAEREQERIVIAMMYEWAYDNIEHNIALSLIITALRSRVVILL